HAHFEVEDTGRGIASEELEQLFEPFYQSESGKRSAEGTGLGLALSRNLARLMNGDITVESTLGRGSKFLVDIALPETAVQVEAPDQLRVESLAPEHRGLRILVADDIAIN